MHSLISKISVALCTYNGAAYLREQLASLSAQVLSPCELIVCDDASQDETVSLIRSFADEAPFPVRLIVNEKSCGTTANFEQAIRLSSGDLIALCDQDDVWHPDKLQLIAATFERESDTLIAFSDAEVVDEQLQPLGYTLWGYAGFNRSRRDKALLPEFLKHCPAFGMTMVFHSSLRQHILPIPQNIPHDMWTGLMGVALEGKAALINKTLVKYRQHASQQTGGLSRPRGFWQKMLKRPSFDRDPLLDNLKLYAGVQKRLETLPDSVVAAGSRTMFQAKVDHLRTRAAMPRRKLSRLPAIAREFFGLHYHRYSNGIYSAVKDALL